MDEVCQLFSVYTRQPGSDLHRHSAHAQYGRGTFYRQAQNDLHVPVDGSRLRRHCHSHHSGSSDDDVVVVCGESQAQRGPVLRLKTAKSECHHTGLMIVVATTVMVFGNGGDDISESNA